MIRLDSQTQRFVGFTPDAPDDGFPIEGGKGYIVNLPERKDVEFAGTVWTNSSPGVEAAPDIRERNPWAFVVSGRLEKSRVKTDGYLVTVRNTRTDAFTTDIVRSEYFAAAFANLNRQGVVEVGDRLKVTIVDQTGEIAADPISIVVTPESVRQALLSTTFTSVGNPHHSSLLQNYPNPFNPETWIPYQLQDPALVFMHIYDAQGGLVRRLDLGQRPAGFYRSRSRAALWDGRNHTGEVVSSGTYFYHLRAGTYAQTKKMVILK